MIYSEFKQTLQEEIQANISQPIKFMETMTNKVNEVLEAIVLKLEGESVAPIIYPQKLYADYQAGIPLPMIADSISDIVIHTNEYPAIPQLTTENAKKYISFALVNKDENQKMLESCPYKEIHDLAAVPRWYTNKGSFLIDNDMTKILQMTKEEVLDIAQKNTEIGKYTCTRLEEEIQKNLISSGIDREIAEQMCPLRAAPKLYVITNKNGIDGSAAMLSDSFMQHISEKIGSNELYLLPASRHEMLVVDSHIYNEPLALKKIVADVNHDPVAIIPENILSDSVYKYNAKNHSLFICDSRGIFHDKTVSKETIKSKNVSRGRIR